jgi:hypothetical protein
MSIIFNNQNVTMKDFKIVKQSAIFCKNAQRGIILHQNQDMNDFYIVN